MHTVGFSFLKQTFSHHISDEDDHVRAACRFIATVSFFSCHDDFMGNEPPNSGVSIVLEMHIKAQGSRLVSQHEANLDTGEAQGQLLH